jgi:diguanylate cyclase (GGDEF)-like protein/PAS domain S-box-containing protein
VTKGFLTMRGSSERDLVSSQQASPIVKAECALVETDNQFRLLVDSVVDYAIYMLDPTGIVMTWNLGAQRIKGYTADEIIGCHFGLFYAKEDRTAGMPTCNLKLARRDGRYETEGWRLRKDGSRFWASVVIETIHNEDGLLLGFAKVTRDITEKCRAQNALRESERQFHLLVNGVTDYALYMLDPDGIVTSWNTGAQRITGYTADEIIGQHFSKFFTDTDRSANIPMQCLRTAVMEGKFEEEARRVRRDGTLFWANVVIDPIHDGTGTLVGFAKITRDVGDRRRNQEHLYRLAHFDALTELPNRLTLQKTLEEAISSELPVTVLMLDLDGLKDINDTLGHSVGDFVLKAAANRILTCIRDRGTIGRLGGDEFVVVLPALGDPAAATETSRQLIEAFRTAFLWEDEELYLGLSIGIAIGPADGTSTEELLSNADLALYQAKAEEQGYSSGLENGYSLFRPSFRDAVQVRRTCEQELRHAIGQNELELFYQPQVRLQDRRVIGAEALLRWRHPERGLLSPGAFLHVLERCTFASTVGDWAIRTACAHAAAIRRLGLERFQVSVNLFGAQLRKRQMVETVIQSLNENALTPDAVVLELTERIILQNDEIMIPPLQQLRALGVGVAFDDYGTGYASLSLLKRFPLSQLKIDRVFVNNVCSDTKDAAVVNAIIALAETFGLEVVAEGIENEEQELALQKLGCENGQGYLYARPMPAQQMLMTIAKQMDAGTPEVPIAPAVQMSLPLGTALGDNRVRDDSIFRPEPTSGTLPSYAYD